MPALRIERELYAYNPNPIKRSKVDEAQERRKQTDSIQDGGNNLEELSKAAKAVRYPTTAADRKAYRTSAGKALSSHQWDVYDFVLTIPTGRVSTYKDVSAVSGGSPRSVGNALRNNPFAPYIPCHRVIASNLFVGGFRGEWGPEHKTGTQCSEKLRYLAAEGVKFSKNGHLDAGNVLWKGV